MASSSSTRRSLFSPSFTSSTIADGGSAGRPGGGTSTKPPSRTANTTEGQILYLVESLTRQLLASGRGTAEGVSPALVTKLIKIVGNGYIEPSKDDEFAIMYQCKRNVSRFYGEDDNGGGGGNQRGGSGPAVRLEELYRTLCSPINSSLLRHRWALLYLLRQLSQLEPVSTSRVFETFAMVDLPYSAQTQTRRGGERSFADHSNHSYISSSSYMGPNYEHGRRDTGGGIHDNPSAPDTLDRAAFLRRLGAKVDDQEVFDSPIDEATLLRDLVFIFQGIDGHLLKYDAGDGGRHLLEASVSILTGKKDLVLQMAELGWLFRKVSAYAEKAVRSLDELGLVGQAFCFSVQDELTEYYRLVAVIESRLNEQSMVSELSGARTNGVTLRQLAVWIEDPMSRMRLIATLGDSLYQLRGGALASALYMHSHHGDPQVRNVIKNMLGRVCAPIFEMIRRWLMEGELVDNYDEFFVEEKRSDPVSDQSGTNMDDMLWHKYSLRTAMLPRFIKPELGQKIMVTGKAINFMRRYCNDRDWVGSTLKSKVERHDLTYRNEQNLQKVVDSIAEVVNERLIHLLFERYQLRTHLQALKKFMLLGQGDFVTCLMDMIGPDLSKVSNQVYRHDLTGKLESALRSSNAQFESSDILNRLGVRLMESSSGEDGWDVFSLDYQVEAPISAIIHKNSSGMYSRIFHLLWRIKRVEWCLCDAWKGHMSVAKKVGKDLPYFSGILHRCNMTRGQMVHFISNLSSFMMFEVLETTWLSLQQRLKEAKDMDGIIAAHDEYLKRIGDKALMTKDTKQLWDLLSHVLDVIMDFCKLHFDICTEAMEVKKLRRDFEEEVNRRTAAWEWGMTSAEKDRLEARSREAATKYNSRVTETTASYGNAFRGLLEMLQRQEVTSDVLRFLTFRLDFNEYFTNRAKHEADEALYYIEGGGA